MFQWLTHCQKCYYPTFEKYLPTACSITRGRIFPFQQILLYFLGWADLVPAHRHFMLCVLGGSSPRPSPSCVSSGQWSPLCQESGDSVPCSLPRDPERALRKQDPPTNPSTLRLRSLFPEPLLVRVHNRVHKQNSCHSRFSCVQEGSWYQHHVTLLGLHIEAKWWPLGLELLFRSDLSGGLHCVLIFTAALRQLCSQGVKTVLTYLAKEEILREQCLNEIIKLNYFSTTWELSGYL